MFNHYDPLQTYRENALLLNQKPKIQSFKFSDKEKCSVVGYSLQKGRALADRWVGDPVNCRKQTIKIPMYRFSCDEDGWNIVWEDHKGQAATHITVAQIPKDTQGNGFKVQRHLDNTSKVLFEEQGYEIATARANPPRLKDEGMRSDDRRQEEIYVRDRYDDGRPIKVTRLQLLWLQFKNVIPLSFVDKTAEKGELAWLNPDQMAAIPKETLSAWTEALPRKRWSLSRTG